MTETTDTAEPEDEKRIRLTAARYARRFPGLDVTLFEAYLSLLHTLRVHGVAIERYLGSLGQPRPISAPRHTILRALFFAKGGQLSQNELSREVGVSPTNITNLIDSLERDGLVTRAISPTDRRAKYVQLTEAGWEFCSAFIPAVGEFMALMFADLGASELTTLTNLLARVRAGMRTRYLSGESLPLSSSDLPTRSLSGPGNDGTRK